MTDAEWDARYRERGDRLWSGDPNGSLVTEAEQLTPRRALDVGCGEGADAIWLASRGWTVTATDVSEVALDRARAAAVAAGITVEWALVDITECAPAAGAYDLVSVQYPALPHAPGEPAIHALLDAVAPGGTLLVVGHVFDDHGDHDHRDQPGPAHHFDPAEYVQPDDVVEFLDDGWSVEVHQVRPRHVVTGAGAGHTHDVVLRVCRHADGITPS